jgi:hypothetical protein
MVNSMKQGRILGIIGTIIWVAGLAMILYTKGILYQFAGLVLFGAGSYGPGVLIWYLIKKTWVIPTRAILMGIGIGLYASIIGTIGMSYFPSYWLPASVGFDIIAIISVPIRASMLFGYED